MKQLIRWWRGRNTKPTPYEAIAKMAITGTQFEVPAVNTSDAEEMSRLFRQAFTPSRLQAASVSDADRLRLQVCRDCVEHYLQVTGFNTPGYEFAAEPFVGTLTWLDILLTQEEET